VGYATKEETTGNIIRSIRQVLRGEVYLSKALRDRLLRRAVGQSDRDSTHALGDFLSDRELDIFRLTGLWMKTSEIALKLHLSVKTVETYRDRIRKKLELKDRTELTQWAVQWVLDNG
jgi:DNA-binding NarL/FixJ family response regulator